LVLIIVAVVGVPRLGAAETVAILSSDTLTSTRRAISGAQSTLTAMRSDVQFIKVQLQNDSAGFAQQIDSIRAASPDIILTVGTTATRVAKENFPSTPIVFSSVMYPVISGFVESLERPGNHVTGASLDIPIDIQFAKFRQIIPDMKRVGVLYTTNTASLIPAARVVAANMGLELTAVEVNGPRDLPRALDSLVAEVDGLWSLADPILFSPQSTKYILLNSLRRGLPLMGFSRNVVESGALFALDFDYKAIGRQAGSLVNDIFNGASPARLAVTTPDIIWFHYNEKTAGHLQVSIPPDLIAIAKEVYR